MGVWMKGAVFYSYKGLWIQAIKLLSYIMFISETFHMKSQIYGSLALKYMLPFEMQVLSSPATLSRCWPKRLKGTVFQDIHGTNAHPLNVHIDHV